MIPYALTQVLLLSHVPPTFKNPPRFWGMLLLIVHEEEDFLDGTQRIAMFLWIANVE